MGYFIFANRTVAKAGDTVGVYYTGTLDNGTVFDSNMNTTPLEFTLGSGQMIAGFDEAVTGMAVGEVKTVTLPVDKAYGPYYPELVIQVNRSGNFTIANPVVGNYLQVTDPDNRGNTPGEDHQRHTFGGNRGRELRPCRSEPYLYDKTGIH